MKKSIIIALVLAVSSLCFIGCEKTSEGLTSVTYYAKYQILGDNPCLHAVGETYVDAGVIATLLDEDVTDEVDITSDVDDTTMGIYSVSYSHTNTDGFAYSESRDVYVYDTSYAGANPEGTYIVQADSYRTYGGNTVYNTTGLEVTVTEFLPGFFYMSDYIGGYYDQYAGYGSSYAMSGYFTLDDNNNVVLINSYLSGWGDSLDAMENGTYDPATKTLSWDVYYVDYAMLFHIVMKAE